MSTIYTDSKIAKIMKTKGNDKCIDCGTEDPTYSSINNGVFICFNCVNCHRFLGDNLSLLKNLISDEWNDEEFLILSKGGNARFLNNLIEFDIVKNNDHLSLNESKIQKKYLYNASEYYRLLLASEVKGTEQPEKPQVSFAKELINDMKFENKEEKKSVMSKVSLFFTNVADKTKTNIEKLDIKTKLKKAGDKTVEVAKNASTFVKEKASQAAKSEIGTKIGKTADSGIGKIKGFFGINSKINNPYLPGTIS